MLGSGHANHRADARRPVLVGVLGLIGPLVLLGLTARCNDTVTHPEESSAYFPLAVGNQWTYAPERSEFGEPFQWTVTERVGDGVTLARPPLGSHPGPVTLVDGGSAVDLSSGQGESGPLYRFWPGASWTRSDPWECDNGSSWIAVTETDAITTPAGTFHDVLRLERRSSATCTDAGTMVEWWARGVGLVRWDELNYYAGGPLTFNLVGYSATTSSSGN